MEFEMKGGTIVGWAVATAFGFTLGAVAFYTPQPDRRAQLEPVRQAPAYSSTQAAPAPTPTPAAAGEHVTQRPAATASTSFGAAAPPPAMQDHVASGHALPPLPAYGAAAGGESVAPRSSGYGASPAAARPSADGVSGRAAMAVSSAPPAPAQPPPPVPIVNVGGYTLQGDSVLAAPPGVDPRRDYRMSIDVSKIP